MSRYLLPSMLPIRGATVWLRGRSIAVLAVAVSVGYLPNSYAAAPPNDAPCGFGSGDDRLDHLVETHKGVSCDQARTILREIKADRSLIPMACRGRRVVGGWRLENKDLDWRYVSTRFTRGNIEIVYTRHGDPTLSCTHVPPVESDEPDA